MSSSFHHFLVLVVLGCWFAAVPVQPFPAAGTAQTSTPQQSTSAAVSDGDAPADSWWYPRCVPYHKQRHTRATRNALFKQIRKTIVGFRPVMTEDVPRIYEGANATMPLKWLPKVPSNNTRPNKHLDKFHRGLQQYAVILHRLVHTRHRAGYDPIQLKYGERKVMLQKVKTQMQLLLCEVENAMHDNCPTVELKVRNFQDRNYGKHVPDELDQTDIQQFDLTVLNGYRRFLKQWFDILKKAHKQRCTHDPKKRRKGACVVYGCAQGRPHRHHVQQQPMKPTRRPQQQREEKRKSKVRQQQQPKLKRRKGGDGKRQKPSSPPAP